MLLYSRIFIQILAVKSLSIYLVSNHNEVYLIMAYMLHTLRQSQRHTVIPVA